LSATAGLTCLVEVAVAYKFSFQNLRQQHSAVPVFIAAVHIVNIYFTWFLLSISVQFFFCLCRCVHTQTGQTRPRQRLQLMMMTGTSYCDCNCSKGKVIERVYHVLRALFTGLHA